MHWHTRNPRHETEKIDCYLNFESLFQNDLIMTQNYQKTFRTISHPRLFKSFRIVCAKVNKILNK